MSPYETVTRRLALIVGLNAVLLAAAVVVLLVGGPWSQLAAIALGALAGVLWCRDAGSDTSGTLSIRVPAVAGAVSLLAFFTLLVGLPIAAAATELGKSYAEAEEACDVSVNFLNPAMPTLAQQTDSSIKLASAVDGFAGTPTFWRLNGLDDDEVRNVMSEIRRNVTRSAAFDLISGASKEPTNTADADD